MTSIPDEPPPARARRRKVVELPGIRPVAPVRVSDDVSEQIRRLIISEGLAEGARLPSERDLAERFGASRPTVSQALRRLSLLGMVEIRRGSGAYVLRRPQTMVTASVNLMLDLDKGSIDDLVQLRLWLETVGVEQAAGRSDPVDAATLARLTETLDRLGEAAGSAPQWIAADTVFHAAVVDQAGNSYLTTLYESVHTAVLSYEYDEWLKTATEPAWVRATTAAEQLALHRPILAAVVERRPAAARAAVLAHHAVMVEHLQQARRGSSPRRRRRG